MTEPPITIRATFSSHTAGDNPRPTRVVIHATAPGVGYPTASQPGMAMSTARYFASGNAGGSAHYVEDIAGETHCVPDDTIAFHAPPNEHSLGIEICAEVSYTREQWLSPQVWPAVARAAARCRELCDRFGIPTVRIGPPDLLDGAHGVCGHVDVSVAWHQSTHTDPGGFVWPEFMAAVHGAAPAPGPAPTSAPPAAPAHRGDDFMADIPIIVKPDGTFRRLVTAAECGKASAVFAAGWVKVGSGWVGGTTFLVSQLRGGSVMPGGRVKVTPAVNVIDSIALLDGCEAATIENAPNTKVPAGAELSAAVVLLPR